MVDISISEITVGSSILSVSNNGNNTERASTLVATYINSIKYDSEVDYKKELVLSGIPLSVSIFFDLETDPSTNITSTSNTYYALDVIKLNDNPSIVYPNMTFTLNGNRLSASNIENEYYINIVESSSSLSPSKAIVLMGIPMATNASNELFINDSNYTINDVQEKFEIEIGGIPLKAGRINNKYYLINRVILDDDT